MARPAGQFDRNKRVLFQHIRQQAQSRTQARDADLSEALGISVRQIQKYLNALVGEGLIQTQVTHYKTPGGWYNLRTISTVSRG